MMPWKAPPWRRKIESGSATGPHARHAIVWWVPVAWKRVRHEEINESEELDAPANFVSRLLRGEQRGNLSRTVFCALPPAPR